MFDIFDLFISSHPHILISLGFCALFCILACLHLHTLIVRVLACILASLDPHIFRFICPCMHPCIRISSGSCGVTCIPGSSHPRILTFICVSFYPRILASSYPQVHEYLLVSLHSHILTSSGLCVLACILSSSHPHILRFMCACLNT